MKGILLGLLFGTEGIAMGLLQRLLGSKTRALTSASALSLATQTFSTRMLHKALARTKNLFTYVWIVHFVRTSSSVLLLLSL